MRPSFNCCSCSFYSSSPCLQNIVKGLRHFLLERLSVRFKQQVLIDEEPREDYADEFEQIRNQREAFDVVQHTIGGDQADKTKDTQRHRSWLLFRIIPFLAQCPREFLQFILNFVASRRRVHSRVRFLNRHGGRFELFPHEGCSSQGVWRSLDADRARRENAVGSDDRLHLTYICVCVCILFVRSVKGIARGVVEIFSEIDVWNNISQNKHDFDWLSAESLHPQTTFERVFIRGRLAV